MNENELSNIVIGISMDVHSALGPGLLENVYKECLYYELRKNGFSVEKEKQMPIIYEDIQLDSGYRIDLLVENKLVLELKSIETLNNLHFSQTLTYMKLGNFRLGLLINFNVARLKEGIKRVANGI